MTKINELTNMYGSTLRWYGSTVDIDVGKSTV